MKLLVIVACLAIFAAVCAWQVIAVIERRQEQAAFDRATPVRAEKAPPGRFATTDQLFTGGDPGKAAIDSLSEYSQTPSEDRKAFAKLGDLLVRHDKLYALGRDNTWQECGRSIPPSSYSRAIFLASDSVVPAPKDLP